MNSRLQASSMLLLIALMLSLVPAAALPSSVSAAQTCTDRAQFVADVTVPDGARYDPGTQLGTTASVPFGGQVTPGGAINLSVPMTAPSSAGHYIGYWKFKNASGVLFGIGVNANKSWWVEINVNGSTQTGAALDFTANAGSATWSSGA